MGEIDTELSSQNSAHKDAHCDTLPEFVAFCALAMNLGSRRLMGTNCSCQGSTAHRMTLRAFLRRAQTQSEVIALLLRLEPYCMLCAKSSSLLGLEAMYSEGLVGSITVTQ